MPSDVELWNSFLSRGDTFFQMFYNWLNDALGGALDPIDEFVGKWWDKTSDLTEKGAHILIEKIGLPPEQEAIVKGLIPNLPILDLLGAFGIALASRGYLLKEVMAIIQASVLYDMNIRHPTKILTPQDLAGIAHRQIAGKSPYLDLLAKNSEMLGYTQENRDALAEATRPVLPAPDAMRAFTMGFLSLEQWQAATDLHGLSRTDAGLLLTTMWQWPDYRTLNELLNRGFIEQPQYDELYPRTATPPDLHDSLKALRHIPLDFESVRTLYWRRQLTHEQRNERLTALGIAPDDLEAFDILWDPENPYTGNIPAFPDIIRMAVRDAFDDNAAALYGLDVNYPEVVGNYAAMTGFGNYWARMFWRAHWVLPSISQARDMMHLSDRFSVDDFRKMLVYADYPPYLIGPITDASFRPPTRVDVRRMYREGVYDRAQVDRAYKRLGYNDEDASDLADFAVLDAEQEATGTALGHVLRALGDYLITEETAKGMLRDLGMSGGRIQQRVSGALVDRTLDTEQRKLDVITRRYSMGAVDLTGARTELAALGYSGERINAALDIMRDKKRAAVRRPTLAQLRTFYTDKLLTTEEYRAELTALGYPDRYVNLFVAQAMA